MEQNVWFKTESKDLDFPNLAADSPDLEVPSPTLPWAGAGVGGAVGMEPTSDSC